MKVQKLQRASAILNLMPLRTRRFAGHARTPHPVGIPDERGGWQKASDSPSTGCPARVKEGMFFLPSAGLKGRTVRSPLPTVCLRVRIPPALPDFPCRPAFPVLLPDWLPLPEEPDVLLRA